jgi:hypothetical protein
VKLSALFPRAILVVIVCLLCAGLCTLMCAAKNSQYTSSGSTGYLSKAIKICGDRCQAVVLPPVVPIFRPSDNAARALPRLPDSTVLPKSVSLDAFHFRPPPINL